MERRPFKRLKRWLRYLALRAVQGLIGLLPLGFALALGRALGRLAFRLAGKERRKALASLEIAFPELPPARRAEIGRESFGNLGAVAAELCCLRQIDPVIERYVEIDPESAAVLQAAIAEDKGVLFVTGHVGNFELSARRVSMGGLPIHAVAKETSDPRMTAHLDRIRSSGKLVTIWRGPGRSAAQEMARALELRQALGLLIDQDTRVRRGVFVDFFGRPAWTASALGDFAVRTGAPVVAGFMRRKPKWGHSLTLRRLVVPRTGDDAADSLAVTRAASRAIEQAIRAAPDSWVWMHQRWKTRPEDVRARQAAEKTGLLPPAAA